MKLLARELGVSYRWFRGMFATHTGLGPHQYLLELRLVRARNLLAETEFSVKEIAMQTGFEDEHYFSRLFQQKLNVTPSQWRSRSRRPTGDIANARRSRTSPPSAVATDSISNARTSIAITIFISASAR